MDNTFISAIGQGIIFKVTLSRRKVEIGSMITRNLQLRAKVMVFMQGKIFDLSGVPEDLQISGKMRNNTVIPYKTFSCLQ